MGHLEQQHPALQTAVRTRLRRLVRLLPGAAIVMVWEEVMRTPPPLRRRLAPRLRRTQWSSSATASPADLQAPSANPEAIPKYAASWRRRASRLTNQGSVRIMREAPVLGRRMLGRGAFIYAPIEQSPPP